MRGGIFFVSVLAVSIALSTSVDARPRLLGVLGSFMGGVAGMAGGRHYVHHHHHAVAARNDEQPAAAEPESSARTAPMLQPPPPPASLSSLPEADFATTEDQFFGYVFLPANFDTKFWAHGERDAIQMVFTRGSTSAASNCAQSSEQRADPLIEHIAQATHPNEDQQPALATLRSALVKAFDTINATCRDVDPITPTARLTAMQDRLFAMRNAGLSIRSSLAALYDTLSDEQKAEFDAPDAASPPDRMSSGAGAQEAAQICQAQAQAAYAWPTALIGRRVRPNPKQRASLEALQKTLFGMAMYLRGACPSAPTSTPVERLDAAMHRLDGMIYAVIAIAPALDDFYGQLNDEQKTRFNAINRAST
jgi:hypothetical protein